MASSKEVFAKRKEGAWDEAYQLALELVASPGADDWDRKALAWCCIDLIKRESRAANPSGMDEYRRHLEQMDASGDEILSKQIQFALSLCTAAGAEMAKARALSKSGKHFESAAIYRKLMSNGPASADIHNALSWELYRISKSFMVDTGNAAQKVKPLLQEYLRLKAERPSLIHSCMLQIASTLATDGKLDMAVFAGMWDLQHLRPEDFERFQGQDGKEYPSLTEKVLQQAAKAAAKSPNFDWSTLLPHLQSAVDRYPDNRWLKLRFARALLAIGRVDDAFTFALQVVKLLQSEYWSWELLGDVEASRTPSRALDCYGKALSCAKEEKFITNLRIKFANLLAPSEPAHAKFEIGRAVRFCEAEGVKLPPGVADLCSQPWFLASEASPTNSQFYSSFAKRAETLLAADLEWIDGNVADLYPDPKKEGKFRRRLIVGAKPDTFEISVPANMYGLKTAQQGSGIRLKGEPSATGRFQLYLLEPRQAEQEWDAVPEHIGVVDHVNRDKQLIHFVMRGGKDGLVRFGEFKGDVCEGDAIAVRRVKYTTKDGTRYRILTASRTTEDPSSEIRKSFSETLRVESGMGFTASDIFLPPPLVARQELMDGDLITGVAVLTFNKKRSRWGWRAVSAETVQRA